MDQAPILILGGGINGAAIARELVLNKVPVLLVDKADLAFGATAYSSRLIHGGLRYLEYGEFDLVRESLEERRILLHAAPHLVRPLQLFVPVRYRVSGFWQALRRWLGPRGSVRGPHRPRGLWLVRLGLWFYDRYAKDRTLPPSSQHGVGRSDLPPVDRNRFRWLCSYWDAQLRYPERMVLALLDDAAQLAADKGVRFQIRTYRQARLHGDQVWLQAATTKKTPGSATDTETRLQPRAIINATGAWVDLTLAALPLASRRLIGGTKGSHFVTHHAALRQALTHGAVYTEAADGRPVFLLPFGSATLVGTTDIPFQGDPADAVAVDEELEYLRSVVTDVFPQITLEPQDVTLHYSGVRPLPFVDAETPSAITRRHALHHHADAPLPMWSVIGGKLTTCRSLAEETVRAVLPELGLPVEHTSADRHLPGAEGWQDGEDEQNQHRRHLADRFQLAPDQVAAMDALMGNRWQRWFTTQPFVENPQGNLAGTRLPRQMVAGVIRDEWVQRMEDLVERRLMLLYDPDCCRRTLEELADLMQQSGTLSSDDRTPQIQAVVERLETHFGRTWR